MKIEYVINLISDDVHESLSMWTTVFCYSFSLVICQGVFRSERVASRSPRTGCKLEVPRCSSYDGWLTVFEGRHRSVGFARILSTEKFWFWTRNCPWIPTGRKTHIESIEISMTWICTLENVSSFTGILMSSKTVKSPRRYKYFPFYFPETYSRENTGVIIGYLMEVFLFV